MISASAIAAISAERGRQDKQHGGPAHDDFHSPANWQAFIRYQLCRADSDPRSHRDRMVKIAALAIASIEAEDRRATRVGEAVHDSPNSSPKGAEDNG